MACPGGRWPGQLGDGSGKLPQAEVPAEHGAGRRPAHLVRGHRPRHTRHYEPVRGLRSGQRLDDHPALRRHRHQEFLRFLNLIDAAAPKTLDLHLVLDDYATYKAPSIKDWLARHPVPPALHPTNPSWLNLVERWLAKVDQPEATQVSPRRAIGR